jgi:hypothetical protein
LYDYVVTVIVKEDVERIIFEVVEKLNSEMGSIENFSLTQKFDSFEKNLTLQSLMAIKDQDAADIIRQFILAYALNAESVGPGSFTRFIRALKINLTKSDNSYPNTLIDNTSGVNLVNVAKRSDMSWLLDTYATRLDVHTRELLMSAMTLAGFGGKIVVERSNSSKQSCELIQGYTFNQTPAFDVNVSLTEPMIICIDGFIESVSEINKLLLMAAETKSQVIMFVRGLSNDVINTLKVNYDRRTLTVIPVIVKFDLDGLNQMKDVSISSGAELISSDKGDLISNVDLKNASRVKSAVITPNYVSFDCAFTSNNVVAHVNDMRRRRSSELVDDKQKMLDARIRTMIPKKVIIRLLDDVEYVAKSQNIDYVLRAFKSMVDHGIIMNDDEKILASSFMSSAVYSKKCAIALRSLGAIVKS